MPGAGEGAVGENGCKSFQILDLRLEILLGGSPPIWVGPAKLDTARPGSAELAAGGGNSKNEIRMTNQIRRTKMGRAKGISHRGMIESFATGRLRTDLKDKSLIFRDKELP
jgi:hypothetical protein